MIKKLPILGLAAVLAAGCGSEKSVFGTKEKSAENTSKKSTNGLKSYGEVITSEAESDEGLFTTHFVDDKLYFEIPVDL
ncbi:MAG: DUF5118 domain-containing protein, partial [Salegentibacter mishustinae]|nr:DUF5118 domain-containing protein [Salegentibacter mishustinae]